MKNTLVKRVIALASASVIALSMIGCSATTGGSSEPAPAAEAAPAEEGGSAEAAAPAAEGLLENGRWNKIIMAANQDPQDLDPDSVNAPVRYNMIYAIYETLFDMADDSSGELKPCIASGYEVVDGATWKVTLRDNVYDWEGNNITANDVAFDFDYIVSTGNAVRFDWYDSIEVIDDYTFLFHWTGEPPAIHDLEFPLTRTIIFSEKAWKDHGESFAKDAVGTGSYKVAEFTPGSKLILEANDDYWGKDIMDELQPRHRQNVQTIEFDVVTEASTAVVGLETGKLDICEYVPLAMQDEFATGQYSDKFNIEVLVAGDYFYLAPNCLRLDQNLRLAIMYAIDNAAVAKAMGGSYVPLKTFGTSYYKDYDESLELDGTYLSDYDLDKAKEYLAASDYDGRELVILIGADEASKAAATMVQTMLLQIGVNSKIDAKTQDGVRTACTNKDGFDIYMNTVGGPSMVGSWHLLFDNEVNVGYTTSFVQDDKLQELYKAANADATHDAAHMKECLDYVIENGYFYVVAGTSSALVYPKTITSIGRREGYVTPNCSVYQGQ